MSASQPPPPSETPGSTAAPADDDPYVGKMVTERYRVHSKLGEGGMGAVYLAEHVLIEKKMALKLLHGEYIHKPDLVTRFLHEAKAASKIDHPNVVQISDFGQTETGAVFFAMEYLRGEDLASHLKTNGPWKWRRAKGVFIQLCRALQAAHVQGIIHRDMKPDNVFLLEKDGQKDFVKVLDFGIAKMAGLENSNGQRLTRTGMIFGTPEYMSPEQARGDKPDHRVDIYAVGCIMYELMTGAVPFVADTFMGVLTKHMFDPVVPPRKANPVADIPAPVEALILKALEKNRDKRFASMAEMADALEQVPIEVTEPSRARRVTPASGRRGTRPPTVPPGSGSGAGDDLAFPTQLPDELPESFDDEELEETKSSKGLYISLGVAGGLLLLVLALVALHHGGKESDGSSAETAAAAPQHAVPNLSPLPPTATPPSAQAMKDPPATTPRSAVPGSVAAPVANSKPAGYPMAQRCTVAVSSTPSGAELLEGGRSIGRTPYQLTTVCTTTPVRLALHARGYADGELDLVPDDPAGKSASATLVPLRASPPPSRAPSRTPISHSSPRASSPTPPAPPHHAPSELQQPKDLHNPFQ